MAVGAYGDPYRLFYGYDVKGDTCGRKNDQLDIYDQSGQDLSQKKFLYFDIVRSGIPGLSEADLAKIDVPGVDLNTDFGDDKIGYCLTGKVTYNDSDTGEVTEANEDIEEKIGQKMLEVGDINSVLTGGDSCRYCLESCPEDQ